MDEKTYSRNSVVPLLILGALALTLLVSYPVGAQVVGATLSGTVTDTAGAVIPGAQVSIKNEGTGVSRSVTTNGAGFYTAPNLLPGTYDIAIEATGFKALVRSGIRLTVGAEQALNLSLQIGNVTEKVEVTGQAPDVQLASSTLSNFVDATAVRDLPLNGRDWTLLAALQPGISSAASEQNAVSTSFQRGNRGFGTQLSISGTRPQQNNYRIDGISVNDYANSGPGSVLGSTLGVDAISEFSVLSSNYSAEYGRTSGGVINAITRSGTNNFHGDAYEFLRNSVLDAATSIDNRGGIPKPPFKQNQFGAAGGGPIRKDRTFFFGDYEAVRQSLGLTNLDIVPSQNARNGLLSFASPASFPAGCVATSVSNQCQVTISPQVAPFLGFWPLPNNGIIPPGNTGNLAIATQQVGTENFVTGRVDHKISDKDNIFGSYQYDKGLLNAPDALDNNVTGNTTFRQLVAFGESHTVNPKLITNFRLGFNRLVALEAYSVRAINPSETDMSLSAVPGQNAPVVGVTGLTAFSGGVNAAPRYNYYWNSSQGYVDNFLTQGKHAIKFGGDVERIALSTTDYGTSGGKFSYGSLASFLTNQGQGATFTATFPGASSPFDIRQTVFGAYVQDDIRWYSNLTVNLGARYEISSVPTETHGKIANLYNLTDPQPHCGILVAGCGAIGSFFSNPTLRNFEPRVGFAWDPFRNGKTSVRSGFGLYDVLPLPYLTTLSVTAAAPFFKNGSLSPVPNGAFPAEAFNDVAAAPRLIEQYAEPNPPRSYVMQWNFNVQRELLPNLTVMVGYVGSRGVHQPFHSDDANGVLPTATPQGYLWPCGGPIVAGLCTKPGNGTPLNPNVGRINALFWSENTFYDDLEVQVTRRMNHGLEVQGAYTWGKAIDEGSAANGGGQYLNSINTPFFFDLGLFRGPADFNVAQKLVINYSWLLPTPKSLPGGALLLLGGWQLEGIYTQTTGEPFTLTLGGDPLGSTSTSPVDFPNRVVGPGCQSAVNPGNVSDYIKPQCFTFPNPSTLLGNEGRNSLTGPGLMNFDFSLFKNNYIKRISEDFNVQFRAELFNAFNRANFAAPTDQNQPFDTAGNPVAGFGVLDLLATPAREIQFAIKLIW